MKRYVWGRRVAARAFIVAYLAAQLGIPLVGLGMSLSDAESKELSWHMYSRIPGREDDD